MVDTGDTASLKHSQPESSAQAHSSVWARELAVLGGGLAGGLKDAAANTWSQTEKTAVDMVDHPLCQTAKLFEQHWQDLAMGAAITFINPGRLGNLALLGFSLRGLIGATADAGWQAYRNNKNEAALEQSFRRTVSEQGTAMAGSLPFMIAGGLGGKALAGEMFGANFGLADLATGKVGLADLKANLWALHDAVRPPGVKLVVTDMDGTVAPFDKFYTLGLKRAISDLSEKTGVDESQLYTRIGKALDQNKDPWIVEAALAGELKAGQPGGMSYADFSNKIAMPFWKTIDDSLKRNYKLFDGVASTFEELRQKKVTAAGFSRATEAWGMRRATLLGLDQGLLDRMVLAENPTEPADLPEELIQPHRARLNAMRDVKHGFTEIKVLPWEQSKPEPTGLNYLMAVYKVRPSQVLMVGDSLTQDMAAAKRAGVRGLLVDYDLKRPQYTAVMKRLSKGSAVNAEPPAEQPSIPYEAKIGSYREVLHFLSPRADYSYVLDRARAAIHSQPGWQSAVFGIGILAGSERHQAGQPAVRKGKHL